MSAMLIYVHGDGRLTKQRVWWYGPPRSRRLLSLGRKRGVVVLAVRGPMTVSEHFTRAECFERLKRMCDWAAVDYEPAARLVERFIRELGTREIPVGYHIDRAFAEVVDRAASG